MTSPLVSIIVPVYNVERYLDRCLNSLVKQTYSNLEIILVDDGSTDGSSEVCDYWEKKDSRIIVVHKKNAGLGMARNTGLEKAKGRFVSFLDSDDFIDVDMYQLLIENLLKSGADTSYCALKCFMNDTKEVKNTLKPISGIYTGKEVLKNIIGALPENKRDFMKEMSVCASLFSLEIIKENDIKFVSERELICEDLIFDFMYLLCSKKVVLSNEAKYYYCFNKESLTHVYNPNRFAQDIVLYQKVKRMIEENLEDHEMLLRFQKLFLGLVRTSIVQEVNYNENSFRNKIKIIRKYLDNDVLREVLDNYPLNRNSFKQKVFNYCLRAKSASMVYLLAAIKK